MKNFVVRYGLISGMIALTLSLINWFFIAKPFGYDASQTFGYAAMIAALLTIPVAIKYFKEKLNQGAVSFSEGFKIGLGISFIAGVVTGLYSMIFFMVQGDEFMEWWKNGLTPVEWEAMQIEMANMPEYLFSPVFQGLVMFVTQILIGIVITLLSSLILRAAKG